MEDQPANTVSGTFVIGSDPQTNPDGSYFYQVSPVYKTPVYVPMQEVLPKRLHGVTLITLGPSTHSVWHKNLTGDTGLPRTEGYIGDNMFTWTGDQNIQLNTTGDWSSYRNYTYTDNGTDGKNS